MIKRLLAIFGLSIISLIVLAVPFWAKSHLIAIASEPEHIPPPPQNKGVLFKHPANSNKILEDKPNFLVEITNSLHAIVYYTTDQINYPIDNAWDFFVS